MAQVDFVKMEERVLKFWRADKTFEKSLKKRRNKKRFVFYEGPPFANGKPGIHHVLARSYKDIILRYKTMRGFLVERKGGWDTHGLPVELQIEKELGLTSKNAIETYGIAKFIRRCRESVWRYKKEWEELTERMGFWLDLENAYVTYDTKYIESLWWIIKQFWQKGFLEKDHKVVPYCPRCGTPESSHEVAQGYKSVKDRSVYVKFKIQDTRYKIPNTYFLAWTTTPWTLPGNVAIAVGRDIRYAFVKQGDEVYILAKSLLQKLDGDYKVLKEVLGKELDGTEYEPLFSSLKGEPEKKHYVAFADFVSIKEGTGIVHTAVMYGEDDYQLGTKLNLPKKHTVDEEGRFNELVPQWKGMFVKDAESSIVEDLKKRNLLYKEELYEHEYPFCWRCGTPLLYYAKDSWFVRVPKAKNELLKNNEQINWVPSYIKYGRFGEWLKEVRDWAFSRERYWGTPLPVWECDECGHREVVGSVKELQNLQKPNNAYYILRHGHSERQVTNVLSSWPEKKQLPLTPKGRKQIQELTKRIQKEKIDVIISSDLLRTKETAEIVAKELGIGDVKYDERLREADMGIFNGRHIDEFGAYFRREGETSLQHFLRRFQQGPPKGETYVHVQKRVYKLMQDMEKKFKGKKILLVSHELPLTLLESLVHGFTREEALRFRMKKAIDTGGFRSLPYENLPYNSEMEVDLHRPYVDEITFACQKCREGTMKRVKEVVDVWFDSGAMPFASGVKGYPADYIVEAVDQTRGWFYTLLAVATLLGKKAPYLNVISLGHILDEKGEKMSKSKGNIVDPWQMIEKYGIDAVRWYFYTASSAGDPKLFSEKDVQQAQRKFLLTLWNSFIFLKTYSPKPHTPYPIRHKKHALDAWIISRLHTTAKEATKRLDKYDITGAGRVIESFVSSDLSLWYIRRSRARFQNPKTEQQLREAGSVLRYVLLETSKLTAPFIPFLSEHIYGELGGKGSAHWADYPKTESKKISAKLEKEMARVRELVAQGLAERAKVGIRVRQPLQKLKVKNETSKIKEELLDVIKDELNVKEVVFDPKLEAEVELDTTITPELREEGLLREVLRTVQDMRKQAGYKPRDKAVLRYEGAEEIEAMLAKHTQSIMRAVALNNMQKDGRGQAFHKEQELFLEGKLLWVGIKKV